MHGADYFRRWHRDKSISGGLLVHKSSHHFDLVNWWLADVPSVVYAAGALRFYGDRNAAERGITGRPARSTRPRHGPRPLRPRPRRGRGQRRLYLDGEKHDGYVRDQDVFDPGITIEDNAGRLVDYASVRPSRTR